MTILSVQNLAAGYGAVQAVFDVSLKVSSGEIVALLGANGAGKTTSLLTIAGFVPKQGGTVLFDGKPVAGTAPHVLARRGLGFVPDDRALLSGLTVAENLDLVRDKKVDVLMLFPELARLSGRRAGLLSGGEQQMLALARVLAKRPRLLLIDELSLGLAPVIVLRLLQALRDAVDKYDTGVLLVEQHVEHALRTADRGYVMSRGRIVLEGKADELLERRESLDASYLGG